MKTRDKQTCKHCSTETTSGLCYGCWQLAGSPKNKLKTKSHGRINQEAKVMEELIKKQKYTEAERHEIYKEVKKYFNSHSTYAADNEYKLNIALCKAFEVCGYNIKDFPEIMEYSNGSTLQYWWPICYDDLPNPIKVRIDALDNCIEKTKQKPISSQEYLEYFDENIQRLTQDIDRIIKDNPHDYSLQILLPEKVFLKQLRKLYTITHKP